ncbi:GNAT family N-acetyltransferase [Enemella sp. A6]|uniref:GNAT family N-acetyltransferase n=1 Tax=Enemella sp. A6 TaxID=3440152 RepID=UPI003EBF9198
MIPEFLTAQPTEEQLLIRAAGPDDLAVIYEIETAGFDEADRWSQLSWAAELTGGRIVLLAGDSGVITLQVVGDIADLLRVVVVPEARGRGLGRALVAEGLAAAAARGAERLLLEVESDNTAALTLYRNLGFTDIDCRHDYYGPGRDAVIMQCRLVQERADD